MRKFAGTFAAVAVLLALGAYVVFVEGLRPQDKDAERVMLSVPADEIVGISIEHGGSTVRVERKPGREWAITEPRKVAASQSAVNDVADALSRLKAEKRVRDEAADLAPYGLSSPETRVSVTTQEGTKTILVGASTPVGGARYAKLAEADAVYVLGSETVSALQKGVDDLREREICKIVPSNATELRVVRPGQDELRLAKKGREDEDWRITHPFEDAADGWKVSGLIWDLAALTAQEFVDDEGRDLGKWGLDRPRVDVELALTDRSAPLRVLIGAPGPDGAGFYVKTSDGPSVYLVKPESFSLLETSAFDLLNKELLTWSDEALARVRCEAGDAALSLAKEGESWKSSSGRELPAIPGASIPAAPPTGAARVVKEGEQWQVKAESKTYSSDDMSKLWEAIRGIEVTSVVSTAPGAAAKPGYGLDRPRVRVRLELDGGRALELKIGAKGKEGAYAVATGRNLVYAVDESKVAALDAAIRALSS